MSRYAPLCAVMRRYAPLCAGKVITDVILYL